MPLNKDRQREREKERKREREKERKREREKKRKREREKEKHMQKQAFKIGFWHIEAKNNVSTTCQKETSSPI
jgi:hypothetical protein